MAISPNSAHPIAAHGELPLGWEFWGQFDRWYIARCEAVMVLMLDGWRESRGVSAEIAIARELGKPVRFIDADGVERVVEEEAVP